ncbi:glycoside hydrolase family 3 protein [Hirschia litorea]|uniref:Glycoside hydrolase family 3 N-terminal domain-containing protein n=1 Tax=Hirschia litorea TaxID=1199156 RepID=A0ABW2INR9_9PROT
MGTTFKLKFMAACMMSTALFACAESDVPTKSVDAMEETKVLWKEGVATPDLWPALDALPLDQEVEQRAAELLSKMTLEQKVGQVIQADSDSITPEEVKQYRLGSVLSGGSSAPGDLPHAPTQAWLEAADAYFTASIDPEGVEVAIPLIWGIDAVHGHANLDGAVVFPHNIGLGAANNPDLIEKISEVTAKELIVSGHDWTFAPTLAVPRDARWGRTYEGFSQSPEITSQYSSRIVEGLQGVYGADGFMGPGRVISSAKHFLGDGATKGGIDQGDADITEEELRDIDAAGYIGAVESGVQTIMASFSSWNGKKMHGNKSLLTGVLKERMNFQGFIVGDWNGHGQVAGCTNTDCPQAINAGLDMYMAPDSWKGLYETTLAHVKSGVISQERLDDAVYRILRVKLASGIFEKGLPSERKFAGDESILGSQEHRAVARQAVRESMVLLKNNDKTLPLDASKTVLVIGDGANSISKVAGGWTLSWQGGGASNDLFPNGISVLDAIKNVVEPAGGKVVFSANGDIPEGISPDAVIAVYGEDPYAEFQGDVEHLAFVDNGFDTETLGTLKDAGLSVVSVFLSGRTLWANPQINDSDAFIAAWLPGSEGSGVADMLFRTDPSYEFTGRLPYKWPATADADKALEDKPLFDIGYGLSYASAMAVPQLSEEAGVELSVAGSKGEVFVKGGIVSPWSLVSVNADGYEVANETTDIKVGRVDYLAQEDALKLEWQSDLSSTTKAAFYADTPFDLFRESNGAMELAFAVTSLNEDDVDLQVQLGCSRTDECAPALNVNAQAGVWNEVRVSLSCFADQGVDMAQLDSILSISAEAGSVIGLGDVRVVADADGVQTCPGK